MIYQIVFVLIRNHKGDRKQERNGEIKKKSRKLAKKERKRFSILQSGKECYLCKTKEKLDKHEAFGGCRRQKSMEYGLVYYLCRRCHTEVENSEDMKKQLRLLARVKFNAKYGAELFLKEFGKDC